MVEKYYIIGSSLLCALCNITPLAAGQLGYNASGDICWYNNADHGAQFRWAVGTSNFWILLMEIKEVICFVVLATFVIQHQSCTAGVLSTTTTCPDYPYRPVPWDNYQNRPVPPPLLSHKFLRLDARSVPHELYGGSLP
ncbi:hypothetical protein C8R43DRAFT_1242510, partial [Mycena crocata]